MMMEKATETDKSRHPTLSERQLNAIEAIISGATDSTAAKWAGVTRQTVNTWKRHNPDFIAELNRRREAVYGASCDRLRGLVSEALDAIEKELQSGTSEAYKCALKLLQIAGMQGSPLARSGPIDERVILARRAYEASVVDHPGFAEPKHLTFARQMMRRDEVLESAPEDLEANLEEMLAEVALNFASALEDLKRH
jgi:hypothetical protein